MERLAAAKEISIESQKLFDTELCRDQRWSVKTDGIYLPGSGKNSGRIITAENLSKRKIPLNIAKTLLTYMRIEDQLGPYAQAAFKYASGIEGYVSWYAQWVREEYFHSRAIRFILMHAPNDLEVDFGSDFFINARRKFKAPYQSRRKNLDYTAIQESMTNQSYMGVIKGLEDADCEDAVEAIRLVAHDEAFHRSAFIRFVELEAKFNPKGAIKDALDVAKAFKMPAIALLPSPTGELLNMRRTLRTVGFDLKTMADHAKRSFLREVPGITQEQITQLLENTATVAPSAY